MLCASVFLGACCHGCAIAQQALTTAGLGIAPQAEHAAGKCRRPPAVLLADGRRAGVPVLSVRPGMCKTLPKCDGSCEHMQCARLSAVEELLGKVSADARQLRTPQQATTVEQAVQTTPCPEVNRSPGVAVATTSPARLAATWQASILDGHAQPMQTFPEAQLQPLVNGSSNLHRLYQCSISSLLGTPSSPLQQAAGGSPSQPAAVLGRARPLPLTGREAGPWRLKQSSKGQAGSAASSRRRQGLQTGTDVQAPSHTKASKRLTGRGNGTAACDVPGAPSSAMCRRGTRHENEVHVNNTFDYSHQKAAHAAGNEGWRGAMAGAEHWRPPVDHRSV